MCCRPLLCWMANAAILIGPAIATATEKVWTASPVRPVEQYDGGRQVTASSFPAHTIESQLHMVVRVKIEGHWVAVGETPGTVDVPDCDDVELLLGWLRASSCDQHVKEVKQLGIRRLELRSDLPITQQRRSNAATPC